jgi:hypothetical protein
MPLAPFPKRLIAALVITLAECTQESALPSSSTAPTSETAVAPVCESNQLISPGGEPLDLTGTWDGGIFLHHVRQVGDCVSWIGYARWPGTEPGELATITFFGHTAADFSVAGTWTTIVRPDSVDAYYAPSPDGPVRFLIEFDPKLGTVSELVLTGYDPGLLSFGEPNPYPAEVLRWVGPLPESANPPQQ